MITKALQFFVQLRSLFVNVKLTDVILIFAHKYVTPKDGVELNYEKMSIPCHKIVVSAFYTIFILRRCFPQI